MIYTIKSLGKPGIRAAMAEALNRPESLCTRLVQGLDVKEADLAGRLAEAVMEDKEDRNLLLFSAANSSFSDPNELDLILTGLQNPVLTAIWEDTCLRDAEALINSARRLAADEGFLPKTTRPESYATPSADSLFLETYAENLNRSLASSWRRPVIGREAEVEMLQTILLRMGKPNAFILGDAGVGKTAVVEGLVYQINDGKVDPALRSCTIYSLDVGALVGGTSLVGAFEERMRKLLKELKSRPDCILFIDEVHMAKGAGAATGNATDLMELLKKALGRREFRAIVATTQSEYEKFIGGNKAFARRFQYMTVDEPDRDAAIAILKAWSQTMSRHYHLPVDEAVLSYAVDTSQEFVPERRLPDKAIDVLDFAASLAVRQKAVQLEVDHLRQAFFQLFKIPQTRLSQNDSQYFTTLQQTLEKEVIGQSHAVEAVLRHVRNGRLGLREKDKPLGMLLFGGPTGVGKTELAMALSRHYYTRAPLIIFHMAEYKESHDAAKLTGSAPGLVGYEDGGRLINAIARNPNAIILLDEIEKAHQDVFDVLLGIFDKGEMINNHGDVISARNVFFIMTTNLLTQEDLLRKAAGFQVSTGSIDVNMNDKINKKLLERFLPEFINRLDEILLFSDLNHETITEIASLRLNEYLDRVRAKGIKVNYEPGLPEWLAKRLDNRKFGARPLKRLIEKEVLSLFTDYLLTNQPEKQHAELKLIIPDQQQLKLVAEDECVII